MGRGRGSVFWRISNIVSLICRGVTKMYVMVIVPHRVIYTRDNLARQTRHVGTQTQHCDGTTDTYTREELLVRHF